MSVDWPQFYSAAPLAKTVDGATKRKALFAKFDTRKRDHLGLGEMTDGISEVLNLEELASKVPKFIPSAFYNVCEAKNKGTGKFVDLSEFRLYFVYLEKYLKFYELMGGDSTVFTADSFKEALKGGPASAMGTAIDDPNTAYAKICADSDNKPPSFEEVAGYVVKQNVNTAEELKVEEELLAKAEDPPAAAAPAKAAPAKAHKTTKSTSPSPETKSASPSPEKAAPGKKTHTKKSTKGPHGKKVVHKKKKTKHLEEDIEEEEEDPDDDDVEEGTGLERLERAFPVANGEESREARDNVFAVFDTRKRGHLALGEITHGICSILKLGDIFSKQAIANAFANVRTAVPSSAGNFIEPGNEFRLVFVYLRKYLELQEQLGNVPGDATFTEDHFEKTVPILEKFADGQISDPETIFKAIDEGKNGSVTFDAIAEWTIRHVFKGHINDL